LCLTCRPEDFIAKEYRELIFAVKAGDDDEESGMSGTVLSVLRIVFGSAVLGLGVGWYLKQTKLRRTGRHKKFDDSTYRSTSMHSSNGKQVEIA
jgi:hypothetical protein